MPRMTTLTIRISEQDLKLLREISDSRGTSPAQVIREMVRLYLAEAEMLDEKDADAARLLEAGQPRMLEGGSISLQSESHPVQFRKVELLELAAD